MSYFTPSSPSFAVSTFNSSTLLLPQPSLASLPQLATDLLIHFPFLDFPLVGYLALQDFIPTVSGLDSTKPSGEEQGITFSVSVYHSKNTNITIVLPRSPVIRARKEHFLASIKKWVEEVGFGEVLLVGSVDAATRTDDSLSLPTPLRQIILPSPSPPSPLHTILTKIPPYSHSSDPTKIPLIPSGGLTRKLLSTFISPPSQIKVSALLIYTSEGAVEDSAVFLADCLVDVLRIENGGKWVKPKSWELGLLGDELGRERGGELYG